MFNLSPYETAILGLILMDIGMCACLLTVVRYWQKVRERVNEPADLPRPPVLKQSPPPPPS